MLDYVKNNMSELCDQNEAAADRIGSLLKDFNTKLTELDEALKEARDLVKKANAQNGLNAKTLEILQVRKQHQLQLFILENLTTIRVTRHVACKTKS